MLRCPTLTLTAAGVPAIFLLLFVYAEHQPFTPFIEALRGLLMGTPIGNSAILAIGWCAVIALGGYLWAKKLYNREPTR